MMDSMNELNDKLRDVKLSDFTSLHNFDIFDAMYDAHLEGCADYQEGFSNSKYDELIDILNKVTDDFAKKEGLEPDFYAVKNVRIINVSVEKDGFSIIKSTKGEKV